MQWTEGKALEPLKKPAIHREQLKHYAEASWDHNPIHLDDEYAKKQGFPSVIAHGMLSMGFMADHVLTNFSPEHFQLARLKVRFRKPTFPGDELTCGGSVKKVAEDGKLTLALWLKNQNEETTTEGDADVIPAT